MRIHVEQMQMVGRVGYLLCWGRWRDAIRCWLDKLNKTPHVHCRASSTAGRSPQKSRENCDILVVWLGRGFGRLWYVQIRGTMFIVIDRKAAAL